MALHSSIHESDDEIATRLLPLDEATAGHFFDDDATAEAAPADADIGDPTPAPRRRPLLRAGARWQVSSPRLIVLLVAVSKFCIVCSGMTLLVPLFRLIEDAICHAVLDDASPGLLDEMRCKDDAVQARLATFLGWSGLVGSLVTLVTAFPFGAMADRLGRKPTALLAYGGIFASFFFTPLMLGPPLRARVRANPYLLLWGNLFQVAGGGIPVLLQTLYAMAADVSSEADKSSNFLYVSLGSAAGGLLGPLLAGLLMTQFGPWVPIWLVIAISPLLIGMLLLLPETLPTVIQPTTTTTTPPPAAGPLLFFFRARIAQGLSDLHAPLRILRDPGLPLVLLTFLTQNARATAHAATLVQYVSKNYGWTLGRTSVLLSPVGLLALAVLATLPRVRVRLSAFRKDLLLTRASVALLAVGAAVQGLSPGSVAGFVLGLVVATLGTADSPLARATASHYVRPAYTSRLYALIGAVEVLGSFVGAPVLAYLFNVGLERKGLYTGLPYFYVALLEAISLAALMFVREPSSTYKSQSGDETPLSADDAPRQGAIRL